MDLTLRGESKTHVEPYDDETNFALKTVEGECGIDVVSRKLEIHVE